MKNKTSIAALLLLSLFISCHQTASELKFGTTDNSTSSLDPNQVISFSQIKSTILVPHCLNCHSSVGTESNLKKWITPGNPQSSVFFTTVENGSMPKNQQPLDTKSLEMIKIYIEQMATNPTVATPTTPTTPVTPSTGVSFDQIKVAVLSPYKCLNCHAVSTETQLAKWINKTTPEQSVLYTEILSGSMPPSGSTVSTANEELVLQYIKDFAAR